jgi:hypothetical protein
MRSEASFRSTYRLLWSNTILKNRVKLPLTKANVLLATAESANVNVIIIFVFSAAIRPDEGLNLLPSLSSGHKGPIRFLGDEPFSQSLEIRSLLTQIALEEFAQKPRAMAELQTLVAQPALTFEIMSCMPADELTYSFFPLLGLQIRVHNPSQPFPIIVVILNSLWR